MMWPFGGTNELCRILCGRHVALEFLDRNSLKLALDGWPCEHRSPEAISICSVPTFLTSQLFWVIQKWLILQTKTSPPPKKDMFFPYQKKSCVFSQPQTCIGKKPAWVPVEAAQLEGPWPRTKHTASVETSGAPTAEKVNKSDQTKHVSRNISFKTSLEVRSNQHHSPSWFSWFFLCVSSKAIVNVPNPRHCREICAGKAKTSSSWVCANCGSQKESQNLLWP